MVAISFSVSTMRDWVENGIAESNGFIFTGAFPPRVKRQTIRIINYDMTGKTIFLSHKEILENPRLKYNQIAKKKKLQLYWKQRTPECEKLGEVFLKEIFPIRFISSRVTPFGIFKLDGNFVIEKRLSETEEQSLAYQDGFSSIQDLKAWFLKTHKKKLFYFYFAVIRW